MGATVRRPSRVGEGNRGLGLRRLAIATALALASATGASAQQASGKIVFYDGKSNVVQIDAGSAKGVAIGEVFDIVRGSSFICTIKIDQVAEHSSVGHVTPVRVAGREPAAGDVATHLSSTDPRHRARTGYHGSALNEDLSEPHVDALEALYRELHASPELSFHEERTAARLAGILSDLSFKVTEHVGGHGFVGVLENGEGPCLMIRTDLDALPITESTGAAYASKTRVKDESGAEVGVMHACGHDIHMAAFIGAARVLAERRNLWSGTLVMVGQPAEERGAGAKAMLADGLFTRFPRPDVAVALHVSPELAAGRVAYCEGPALASVDSVDLTVRGVGGHGAFPHTAKDPVVIAAQIVLALQTLVSREIAPGAPAVVTVGSIHGGSKHNIIPDEVKLQLTCRSYDDGVRKQILAGIERVATGIARAAGVPEDRLPIMHVLEESIPATVNEPRLTRTLAERLKAHLGPGNVVAHDPVMGGEDFGCYGRVDPPVPICMLWLGAIDPERLEAAKRGGARLPPLHSAQFLPVARPTIATGVRALVEMALVILQS